MWLGAGEIVVVGILALLVFGPEKLPELARQLARIVGQLQHMAAEVRRNVDDVINEPPVPRREALPLPEQSLGTEAQEPMPASPPLSDSTPATPPAPSAPGLSATGDQGPPTSSGQPAPDKEG